MRHVQCLLVFCGLAVAYALRVNLSVAIVAMTDKNSTNPNFDVSCRCLYFYSILQKLLNVHLASFEYFLSFFEIVINFLLKFSKIAVIL